MKKTFFFSYDLMRASSLEASAWQPPHHGIPVSITRTAPS
jgi:hypothetical protein